MPQQMRKRSELLAIVDVEGTLLVARVLRDMGRSVVVHSVVDALLLLRADLLAFKHCMELLGSHFR